MSNIIYEKGNRQRQPFPGTVLSSFCIEGECVYVLLKNKERRESERGMMVTVYALGLPCTCIV